MAKFKRKLNCFQLCICEGYVTYPFYIQGKGRGDKFKFILDASSLGGYRQNANGKFTAPVYPFAISCELSGRKALEFSEKYVEETLVMVQGKLRMDADSNRYTLEVMHIDSVEPKIEEFDA